jgi:integrase
MVSKYDKIMAQDEIRRWYDNMRRKSKITAGVVSYNLALYCTNTNTTPDKILKMALDSTLKSQFEDFVTQMEKKGKKGTYIAQIKASINSWLKYNGYVQRIKSSITNETINENTQYERVPTREEFEKVMRKLDSRGRVELSLIALSGLRLEVIGNHDGTDGLMVKDIEDLDVETLSFTKIPAKINVKAQLSKARFNFFTFISEEGCRYIEEYLTERKRNGEIINSNTPIILPLTTMNRKGTNNFLTTGSISIELRKAITGTGLKFRPYVFRAYFATGMDRAENKGYISHPWRQFLMGHKGDMERKYSTDKRLSEDMVEEMRKAYSLSARYLSPIMSEKEENNMVYTMRRSMLMASGMKGEEIDNIDNLTDMGEDDFQKMLGERLTRKVANNGKKQKVIPIDEVEKAIEEGWEFVSNLGNGKAVMKLP